MRQLIGSKLRPGQYLRDASVDSLSIFANDVGDLDLLYHDVEYARWTCFGDLVCPPCLASIINGQKLSTEYPIAGDEIVLKSTAG